MIALGRGQPQVAHARDAEEQQAGAGPEGEPRESHGQGLLKHTVRKSQSAGHECELVSGRRGCWEHWERAGHRN